jgi:hypothetical protein
MAMEVPPSVRVHGVWKELAALRCSIVLEGAAGNCERASSWLAHCGAKKLCRSAKDKTIATL